MNAWSLNLIASLAALWPAAVTLASNAEWKDTTSGRSYILLDGTKTWTETYNACRSQGYAVLEPALLTAAERAAMTNELQTRLQWTDEHAGSDQTSQTAAAWQAEELSLEGTDDATFAASTLIFMRRNGAPSQTTTEWHNQDERAAQGICMSVPGFWYSCSDEYRCTIDGPNGFESRYVFVDYGPSQAAAMRQLVTVTQEPEWAVSEGQCRLQTENAICVRILP